MALTLWNATDNVQTWFHRLSLSGGEFVVQFENAVSGTGVSRGSVECSHELSFTIVL